MFYLIREMQLTLNQFLLLVITFALVIAVSFLVSFLIQLRKTAREGQETLAEIRALAKSLQEVSQKAQSSIEGMNEILEAAKKTAVNLSEITWYASKKILMPASKFWPFLFPILRFGWRRMKKRKEEKHGK